jgi:hypothetical protein
MAIQDFGFEVGEIYTFKIFGDEVIAKVADVFGETVVVSKPLTVAAGPQGLGLIPAVFTADPERTLKLNIANVAFCARTHIDIANNYIENTTGIKPVGNKILMG